MSERLDILIILDRSGSMQKRRADHEGGLQSFVHDQQAIAGDVRLTFVRFDSVDPCEVVFETKPISEVKAEDITLIPRSGTPLLDAVGRALSQFKPIFPGPAVVMIVTDGIENASREWTKASVQALVKEQEKAGWTMLYLGANVDAFAEAGMMGINAAQAMNFSNTSQGTHSMYRATSANLAAARHGGLSGQSFAYTPEQRTQAMATDDPSTTPKENEKL